jgi:membrane protein required for colicin V production
MMAFFVLKGIFRGFLREVFSLIGVVLGIWAGVYYQLDLASYLGSYLPETSYLPLISFVAVFSLMVIGCNLLGMIFKLFFFKIPKGGIDRALGASVAFIKGVVVTYLLIVMLTFLLPSKTPLIAGSRLAPLIIVSYQSMIKAVSQGKAQKWKKGIMEKKEEAKELLLEKTGE